MSADEAASDSWQPLPHTAEALRELARAGEVSLGVDLHLMAQRVRAVVPELVGLSLAVIEGGITLTLVSSSGPLAALDAVQYLDGGPCVADVERAEPLDVSIADLLDEDRWQLYALAGAALGVASSLSLPILEGDRVVGGVNLYAGTADAFTGRHDRVAEAVGSTAELAVTNADLSLHSFVAASASPRRVREDTDLDIAAGVLAAAQDIDLTTARERLGRAAAQAGVTEAQAARLLLHIRTA